MTQMGKQRCKICGRRAARVVIEARMVVTAGGLRVEIPNDAFTKCDSCGETYYTGLQWAATDQRLRPMLLLPG